MTARWRAAALAVDLPRRDVNTMDNKDDWLNKTKVIWMLIIVVSHMQSDKIFFHPKLFTDFFYIRIRE